jgi:hypothetical protein
MGRFLDLVLRHVPADQAHDIIAVPFQQLCKGISVSIPDLPDDFIVALAACSLFFAHRSMSSSVFCERQWYPKTAGTSNDFGMENGRPERTAFRLCAHKSPIRENRHRCCRAAIFSIPCAPGTVFCPEPSVPYNSRHNRHHCQMP